MTAQWTRQLEQKLNKFNFGSGASTSDLDLLKELTDVHFCEDPVKKLYYSMGYEPYAFIAQVKIT